MSFSNNVWAKLFNIRPLHFPLQDLIILRNAFDLLLPKVRSWQKFPTSPGFPVIGDGHHLRVNQHNSHLNKCSFTQVNDPISNSSQLNFQMFVAMNSLRHLRIQK